MKKTALILLSPFIASLLFPPLVKVARGKTVTLQYCLEKATREHPLILKEKEKIAEAESYLEEARSSRFFPELKLQLFSGPVPDATGSFLEQDQVQLSLSEKLEKLGPFLKTNLEGIQPLYTFGGIRSLIKAAEAGVEARSHQETQQKAEMSEQIIKLYLGYQLAHEVFEVQIDLRKKLEEIQEKIEEWLAAGSSHATQIDQLRLKVFMALLDKEILASEKGITLSRMAFLELCQENNVEIVTQPLSEEIISLPGPAEFIDLAHASRPEINALKAAALAKKALIHKEWSRFFPSVFLVGGLRYGHAPGRTPQENVFIDDEFNYLEGGVAVGLEQNLSFHTSRARLRRARAEYRYLLHSIDALQSAITIDVTKNYENVQETISRINKIREGMKAARTWMFASIENYYLGVEKISEVVDSFGAYLAIKWQFFQAIFDYQKTLMELYLSAGKKPWVENE